MVISKMFLELTVKDCVVVETGILQFQTTLVTNYVN